MVRLIELQSYKTEQEYRESPALNYSKLKAMSTDPESLITEQEDKSDKSFMKIGQLVDTLLTEPERVDELFYYKQIEIPTAQLYELAISYLDQPRFENTSREDQIENILIIANEYNFWSTTKDKDKRIAKFNKDIFWNYIEAIDDSEGKIVMSPEEYNIAQECVMLLSTHEYTTDIFNPKGDHFEVVDQFKYEFKFCGEVCKVMLDKCIVDHKNKVIYPFDIKTGFPRVDEFGRNFISFRYDLQACLYSAALAHIIATVDYFKDFTLHNFRFVYVSTSKRSYPLKWRVSEKQLEMSFDGWETQSGYRYKGLKELIEEYQWRIENNIYDRSKEVIDNNGELELDVPKTK